MSRLPIDPDFEPRVADWLEDDSDDAPGAVLATVLAAFPSISQRRASRVPWRFPSMSTFAKLAVAAVVVIAVGTVGIVALQPGGGRGVGSAPTPLPSASPTPFPSPTAAPSMPPPLTGALTSPTNGISISYPAGWIVRPATGPWTTTAWPSFEDPAGDLMYDPVLNTHLFILMASQPLAGKTGAEWAADIIGAEACAGTVPVTIDGASGLAAVECNVAAVGIDGRGYFVMFYTSDDDPWVGEVYDRAWFEQLLSTIDLRPEDVASAVPSPTK